MKTPISVACIGLGWVAQNRHIPALRHNPAFQIKGLIDHDLSRAKALAKRYGLPHTANVVHDDLAGIPWLREVEAVTISAPPKDHAALALTALKLGKHVLIEKPLAMSVPEGEALCAAAREHNVVLGIVHNFQFGRAAQKLNHDITQGRFGKIHRVSAVMLGNPHRRLPDWHEALPQGLFYDESPHFFYMLDHLAQGPLRLQHAHGIASAKGLNTPDAVSLLYRDMRNTPMTIECQFDSALSEWYILVTGEKQLGVIDLFRDVYLRLPNDQTHGLPHVLRTSAQAIFQHLLHHIPNGFAYLRGRLDYGNDEVFARFANAIRNGKPLGAMGCEKALDVLKLQHEALDALKQNLYK